jgi:hypothetical protein
MMETQHKNVKIEEKGCRTYDNLFLKKINTTWDSAFLSLRQRLAFICQPLKLEQIIILIVDLVHNLKLQTASLLQNSVKVIDI